MVAIFVPFAGAAVAAGRPAPRVGGAASSSGSQIM